MVFLVTGLQARGLIARMSHTPVGELLFFRHCRLRYGHHHALCMGISCNLFAAMAHPGHPAE